MMSGRVDERSMIGKWTADGLNEKCGIQVFGAASTLIIGLSGGYFH
jgi:hypothetical protein